MLTNTDTDTADKYRHCRKTQTLLTNTDIADKYRHRHWQIQGQTQADRYTDTGRQMYLSLIHI